MGVSCIFQTVGSILSSSRIQRLKKKKQIQYGIRYLLPYDDWAMAALCCPEPLVSHNPLLSCVTRENPVSFCWRQRPRQQHHHHHSLLSKILQELRITLMTSSKCTLEALKNAIVSVPAHCIACEFVFNEDTHLIIFYLGFIGSNLYSTATESSRTRLCVSFTSETCSKDRGGLIPTVRSKVRQGILSLNWASAV